MKTDDAGSIVMTTQNEKYHCPLCSDSGGKLFFEDKIRIYIRCSDCKLVFVPKRCWLSAEEEKAVYDLHENNADDTGYRQFLSRLSVPLLKRIGHQKMGLDFGCGPGPTLSMMLEEQGQQMRLFDHFYNNDPSVLAIFYDFICSTEVVEHLCYPNKEFTTLFSILKPGGWMGIMTKLVRDQQAFSKWHYIQDRTHICFYSRETFEYLADRFSADVEFIKDDVIIFHKR